MDIRHVSDCPISEHSFYSMGGGGQIFCFSAPSLPEARMEGGWALKPELCSSDAPIMVFGTLKLKKVSRKAGTVGKSFAAMGLNCEVSAASM